MCEVLLRTLFKVYNNGVLRPGQFMDGGGNLSDWKKNKLPTFCKPTDKLSHTKICPEWNSNLGGKMVVAPL